MSYIWGRDILRLIKENKGNNLEQVINDYILSVLEDYQSWYDGSDYRDDGRYDAYD